MTLARELADTAGRPQVDKNLLINGGMNVWQRATSKTGISNVSTDGYVTVDRWSTYNSNLGTWTQSQSTDVPSAQGFAYSLKMDCTTTDTPSTYDQLNISQKIEAQNCQHLLFGSSSPKSITLSFWVKSNKTGTYIVNAVRADGGIRSISKAYTIDTANTWEKKTITFEGDETNAIANDNGYGIDVQWWLGAGSGYTSGTLQTTWGSISSANRAVGQINLADSTDNEWYMTGCQLEIGEAATDFQFEPYAATLTKCLRYNYRIENVSGTNFVCCGIGTTNSSGTGFHVVPQLIPLRASATMSYSSLSHFDMEYRDHTPTGITLFGANSNGQNLVLQVLQGSTGSGECTMLMLDSAGWINFDAEL